MAGLRGLHEVEEPIVPEPTRPEPEAEPATAPLAHTARIDAATWAALADIKGLTVEAFVAEMSAAIRDA